MFFLDHLQAHCVSHKSIQTARSSKGESSFSLMNLRLDFPKRYKKKKDDLFVSSNLISIRGSLYVLKENKHEKKYPTKVLLSLVCLC